MLLALADELVEWWDFAAVHESAFGQILLQKSENAG
jgi:hypothetical protein